MLYTELRQGECGQHSCVLSDYINAESQANAKCLWRPSEHRGFGPSKRSNRYHHHGET